VIVSAVSVACPAISGSTTTIRRPSASTPSTKVADLSLDRDGDAALREHSQFVVACRPPEPVRAPRHKNVSRACAREKDCALLGGA
jgi:hypothetical protein